MTSKHDLMNFARVCIEINASFSFPTTIQVVVYNDKKSENIIVPVNVEYQSRPPSCPSCKVFGHSPLKCPKANYQWVPKAQPATSTSKSSDGPPYANDDTIMYSFTDPKSVEPAVNDWVTVSRGVKIRKDPMVTSSPMATTNSFSLIANPSNPLPSPDSISPAADNPLISKLKVIDEKEGKELKQKQRNGSENPQAAKKCNIGKGKVGNLSP